MSAIEASGSERGGSLSAPAARLAGRLAALHPEAGRFGLAVSGGPDSLALLLLAAEALPGRFEAASVDHGLRAESAGEAAMVADLCFARGIEHRVITLALDKGPGIQARAREARYGALAAWLRERGLAALVTAHHAEDQAETLVMRFNRGAGLRGLAAMRPRATVPGAPGFALLRPLLDWRRAELAAICEVAGVTPVDDPSNRDPAFERVRVRDGMASAEWLDPAALAISAARLAEADEALDWATDYEWQLVAQGVREMSYAPAAPRAVRLRVLERIAAAIGEGNPRGSEIARWLDTLESGGVATLAGVQGDGRGTPWRFAKVPPHRQNA